MQVLVKLSLLQTLVECIDKQAILDQQTPEIQSQWKAVINDTYKTAQTAIADYKRQNMGDPNRTETGMGPIVGPDKTSYL